MAADLNEYLAKRDLSASPEPAPAAAPPEAGPPRFVVQRHHARSLHFDLRLEADGALISFAVPKGLPLREGVKRLAVETEPHPLEYLDFAGVIPEGQYGAGRMTIWDRGTFEIELRAADEWKVILSGERVAGHYHLVRTRRGSGRDWLLFRSGKGPPGPEPLEARFAPLRPMLAQIRREAFDDDAWSFELKWDGYRTLAAISQDATELRSRTGRDLTPEFPRLADLRAAIFAVEAVIDGEIVVLTADGRPDFQALQGRSGDPHLVAFDLLAADGDWLLDRPLSERRERLRAVLTPEGRDRVMLSDDVVGRGRELLAAARAQDLEGIVAKRRASPYRGGERTADWVKIKLREEEEFAIGGFTPGAGSRAATFGAILVGAPGPEPLAFRGQVGSGFTNAQARDLRARLDELVRPTSPFGPIARLERGTVWTEPTLRCRVAFAEVTADGRLRAPVFAGMAGDLAGGSEPAAVVGAGEEQVVADGERRVRLTNLRKPFWRPEGITKGDLLAYYTGVAAALVPHLAGRPMILKRYPDGADAEPFFQHNVPDGAPDWLRTVELSRSERPGREPNHYCMVDDPLALLWVVNLGCIDLNPWQSLAATPGEPTQVLFDLDPADGLAFSAVVETALLVRDELETLGLRGYPKTTGASGMHVFVPVRPGLSFDVVRLFAQAVGERLVRARPDLVTLQARKVDRGQRVYLDANQNGRGRSISSVYSARPRRGAPVATPLHWSEVGADLDPAALGMRAVAARLEREGDLFAPVLTDRQDLAPAVARLGELPPTTGNAGGAGR